MGLAVKDCLEALGAGAGAGPGAGVRLSSCGVSPSASKDSASSVVGSSDWPLAPVSPPSEAFVGATRRKEGRLDSPAAVLDTADPVREVLVDAPIVEGRPALAVGWVVDAPVEGLEA